MICSQKNKFHQCAILDFAQLNHFNMKNYIIFFLTLISFSTQFSSLFAQQDTIRVLHYTETTGYNHGTWDESRDMFTAFMDSMTATTGQTWILTQDDNGSEFDDLTPYSVVIFSNTSGNSGLSIQQRSNFETWIANGGNVIGIHAVFDTYRHSTANGNKTGTWDFFAETIGGSVQESPNHTSSNKIADITFWNTQYADGLPSPWTKREEYYYWQNGYLAPGFTEVAEVESTGSNSYDAARMVAQYKVLPGGGISFATSLGHSSDNFRDFDDPTEEFYFFGVLLLNALKEANVNPPVFSLLFPEASKTPEILEPGFFYLEQTPIVPLYEVSDMAGRIVQKGIIEGNRVPVMKQSGLWMYRVYGRVWVAGVINN